MAGKRCYYEVLEVEHTAGDSTISTAYRKLAIKYHPDKNPGDDEAIGLFKEAAEAFEVLSDLQKRQRYDQYGHAGVDSGGGGAHFSDIEDIFDAFGGIFGDLFGGGSRGGRRVRRGGDVQCEVHLDLLEAARGVKKEVIFQRHEACDDCDGTGAKPGTKPAPCDYCGGHGQVLRSSGIIRVQTTCPSCHGNGTMIKDACSGCRGSGYVANEVSRKVDIPAGVDTQMRIRLTGEGEPSPNGGPRGDCYCFVQVEEHPLFQREGQHLICRVPITYSQAALGATIEVPTLDGRETLEIESGTQPGQVFTMRGQGMPDPRHRGVGDLLVQVNIEVPKKLDAKEEELLRSLADVEHSNVTPERKNFFEKLYEYFTAQDEQAAS
jgi:molecular chaperone DnaJ